MLTTTGFSHLGDLGDHFFYKSLRNVPSRAVDLDDVCANCLAISILIATVHYPYTMPSMINTTEGFRAKRVYLAFWANFYFLQEQANLSKRVILPKISSFLQTIKILPKC